MRHYREAVREFILRDLPDWEKRGEQS